MPKSAGTQEGDSGEKEGVKEDWRERVELSHLKDASLRKRVKALLERYIAENLAAEDDAEMMHIIKLVDEKLEYQRKPFRHENQILAITGKDQDDEQGTNPRLDETRPKEALITAPQRRPEEALITAP